MEIENESQSYVSEIKNGEDMPSKRTSNNKKKSKNYKSQSNTILKLKKLENYENSLLNDKKSHKPLLPSNYNKELYKIYANFLKIKKFKISNEFDEKNAKKFLDKKDKCMQRIVLSDIIEENNKDDFTKKEKEPKSRRKSGTQKNKYYCIVVSDYDDSSKIEEKYNFSVKFQPRKIDKLKKNNNLSTYILNKKNIIVNFRNK